MRTPGLFGLRLLPRDIQDLLYHNKWTEPLNMVRMGAVVDAESSRYAGAVGTVNVDGSQDYGLFQMNSRHAAKFGYDDDEAFFNVCVVPEHAAPMARLLFEEDKRRGGTGFGPWAAFGTDRWHDLLPAAARGLCNFTALSLYGALVV